MRIFIPLCHHMLINLGLLFSSALSIISVIIQGLNPVNLATGNSNGTKLSND